MQTGIFIGLLLVLAVSGLAVWVDRCRLRDPLLRQTGGEPQQLAAHFAAAPFGLMLLNAWPQVRIKLKTYNQAKRLHWSSLTPCPGRMLSYAWQTEKLLSLVN